MSLIARARLQSLMQTQCRIFNTVYNPDQKRQGTKILRQRLKGATFAAYYPRRVATIRSLGSYYPDYEIVDMDEQDRLESVRITKSRGKGPPKKAKGPDIKGKKK